MSERIAVFGDKESVYGFAALGLDTYFFDPAQDNIAAFRKLCQSQSYSIIYITEAAAADLDKEMAWMAGIDARTVASAALTFFKPSSFTVTVRALFKSAFVRVTV